MSPYVPAEKLILPYLKENLKLIAYSPLLWLLFNILGKVIAMNIISEFGMPYVRE